MIAIPQALYWMHREMLGALLLLDIASAAASMAYVLGSESGFDYIENGAYLFVIFLSFVALHIGIIRKYAAPASFYMVLPVRRGALLLAVLFLQIVPFALAGMSLALVCSTVLGLDATMSMGTRILHACVFVMLAKLTVLPTMVLSSKHPALVLVLCVALVPMWLVTALMDELVFAGLTCRYAYGGVLFVALGGRGRTRRNSQCDNVLTTLICPNLSA